MDTQQMYAYTFFKWLQQKNKTTKTTVGYQTFLIYRFRYDKTSLPLKETESMHYSKRESSTILQNLYSMQKFLGVAMVTGLKASNAWTIVDAACIIGSGS